MGYDPGSISDPLTTVDYTTPTVDTSQPIEGVHGGEGIVTVDEMISTAPTAADANTLFQNEIKKSQSNYEIYGDDLGNWRSLWNNEKKDKNGNVLIGDVLIDQEKNS